MSASFPQVGGYFVAGFPEDSGRWRAAAAALAVAGVVVQAVASLRPILFEAVFAVRAPGSPFSVTVPMWLRAAVWVAIAAAVVPRRRALAVPAVWAGVVFEFAVVGRVANDGLSVGVLHDPRWWPVLVSVVVALLSSVAGPLGAVAHHLGPRGRRLLAATAGVIGLTAAVEPLLWDYYGSPDPPSVEEPIDAGFVAIASIDSSSYLTIFWVTVGVVGVLMVMTVLAVDPGVRSRVVVLLAAGMTVLAVVRLGFTWPVEEVLAGPVLSYRTQPVVLVAALVLIGGLGGWWIRRSERVVPGAS
ncbi:hypothetical protein Areg01_20460 [Actinoplanes regularis]|nr:hypothetical protein Areg01_20460 [Actinoplanes regularis]